MKPSILREQALTPDGRLMTLSEHDGSYTIRVAGIELMTTRQHHSEEQLARRACEPLRHARSARVLIGGLGFGYTLRAALETLRADATLTVVEIMPEVLSWNRKPNYGLAGVLLDDPRVETVVGDAADVVGRRRGFFDAVILDVDNGAAGLTTAGNMRLYTSPGLARLHGSLRPDGILAIWSAAGDAALEERMRRCGFSVITERTPLSVGSGASAWLFIGRKEKAAG